MNLTESFINKQAREAGFDTVGFCRLPLNIELEQPLSEFLQAGHHGTMQWMQDRAHLRADPNALWPEAKSIIVLGHNYAPEANPLEKLQHKTNGNISSYALNQDYHDVIKKKLKQLARWIAEEFKCDVKVFVDTAPVMEKPLAEAAGLGWQGKHTCLVSREFGNWLFLGSIFTTLDLSGQSSEVRGQEVSVADLRSPTSDHCGSCRACLDICPTQAFTAERKLDARKCISYLTIEHKGSIPIEYRKAMGNRIYGCDDCLAVCPWNKFAQEAKETAYHAREALKAPALKDLVQLDDAAFRALFTKSPIKRIGRDRFIRNVLIAIGNSEDASLKASAAALIHDDSELVREAAAWAVDELEKRPI